MERAEAMSNPTSERLVGTRVEIDWLNAGQILDNGQPNEIYDSGTIKAIYPGECVVIKGGLGSIPFAGPWHAIIQIRDMDPKKILYDNSGIQAAYAEGAPIFDDERLQRIRDSGSFF